MVAQLTAKTIDPNGQIFLGLEFAGKKVFIDAVDAGGWLIRTADYIPKNERWIHEPDEQKKLEEAMSWAVEHDVTSENTPEILNKLENEIENA